MNKSIGGVFVFCILLGASVPLAPNVAGIGIYTPYIPLVLFSIGILTAWLAFSAKIRLSSTARVYIVFPFVMLIGCLLNPRIINQINAILPFIFGSFVFVLSIILQRHSSLTFDSVVRFACLFFIVETVCVVVQTISGSNFGILSSYLGARQDIVFGWQGAIRASGTFGQPNVFSQVYTLMSALVAAKLLWSPKPNRVVAGWAVMVISIATVVCSLSRSGFLLCCTLYVLIIYEWVRYAKIGKKSRYAAIAIMIILLLTILPIVLFQLEYSVADRLVNYQDSTRLQMYKNALRLASSPDVWLAGVGAGNFFMGLVRHGIPVSFHSWTAVSNLNTSVHNFPLKIFTENGIIVFLMYFGAIIGFIRRVFNHGCISGMPAKVVFAWPLLLLYLISFQFGTSAGTVWLISFISIYFSFIEVRCRRKRCRTTNDEHPVYIGSSQ